MNSGSAKNTIWCPIDRGFAQSTGGQRAAGEAEVGGG